MTDATFPSADTHRLEALAIDLLELAGQLTPSGRTEQWVRAALAAAAATDRARLCLGETSSPPAAGRPPFEPPRRVPDWGSPTNRTDILDAPSPPPEPAPGGQGMLPPHSVARLIAALFEARDSLVLALPGLARQGDWKQVHAVLCACDALAEALDLLAAPGRRTTPPPE